MKRAALSVVAFALSLLLCAAARATTKVACVGDSITEGAGLKGTYPEQLQAKLGESWIVKNFGQGGTTILKNGDTPYWKGPLFAASNAFAADVVVLMMGTNDAKPWNWAHESDFEKDYAAMVQHYRDRGSTVYVALPPPAMKSQEFWQVEKVIPHIRKVAKEMNAPVIDVHALLAGSPENFRDDVHPNEAGASVIANAVYAAIRTEGGTISGARGANEELGDASRRADPAVPDGGGSSRTGPRDSGRPPAIATPIRSSCSCREGPSQPNRWVVPVSLLAFLGGAVRERGTRRRRNRRDETAN